MKKLLLALAFGFTMLFVGCQPKEQTTPMLKDMDRTAQTMYVRVHTYPNHAAVTRAKDIYERNYPNLSRNKVGVYGWAAWSTSQPGQCEIHVVKPTHQESKEFETWGHELAHCVYGSWHE